MQTLKAVAQLTAPLLTTIATLSLHMDPYERTVAFVCQLISYRGRTSPPPTHSYQRLSQLDQQALPALPIYFVKRAVLAVPAKNLTKWTETKIKKCRKN
jgi:hypothetical protein